MRDAPKKAPSLHARVVLYLVGLALVALPWGYLLFVRPWLRARYSRTTIVPRAGLLAVVRTLLFLLIPASAVALSSAPGRPTSRSTPLLS